MNFLATCWIGILLFATGFYAHADYISSGDLTYRCLGGGKYEFKLVVYAECESSVDLSTRGTFEIAFVSKKLGVNSKFTVYKNPNKITGEEVKIFCVKEATNCTTAGGKRGFKRFEYIGVLDLSTYSLVEDWQMYWQQNFRSQKLTSVITNAEPYFVGVTINTKLANCNSSPTFSSEPIVRSIIGQADEYRLLARDINNDALRYSIIDPKTSLNTNITYKPGFNKATPVSGSAIQIDQSGIITFNTSIANQTGITNVLIEELRNGVVVATTMREIQFVTIDAANAKPVIGNFASTGTKEISICVGDKLDAKLIGSDPNSDQLLSFSVVSGLSGIVSVGYGVKNPEATFTWTPLKSNVGKHVIELKLEDNGCPISQSVTEVVVINVTEAPQIVDLEKSIRVTCDVNDKKIIPVVLGGTAPYSYVWKVEELSFIYNKDTGDTTVVKKYLKDISSETATVDRSFSDVNLFTLTVTDNVGCKAVDSTVATVCVKPKINSISYKIDALRVCTAMDFQFKAEVSSICQYSTKWTVYDSLGNVYRGAINDNNYTPANSRYDYNLTKTGTVDIGANFPYEGKYSIKIVVSTNTGCEDSLLYDFTVFRSPVAKIREENYYINCQFPDSVLMANILDYGSTGGPVKYQWEKKGKLFSDTLLAINEVGSYSFTVKDDFKCADQASVSVSVPIAPSISYEPVCTRTDTMRFVNRTTFYDNRKLASWLWDFGDGTTDTSFAPVHKYSKSGNFNVVLTVTETSGCKADRNMAVFNTFYNSIFRIDPPKEISICVKDKVKMYGVLGDPDVTLSHIDTVFWTFDDLERKYFNTDPPRLGQNLSDADTIYYSFSKEQTYPISLKVIYNKNPNYHTGFCEVEFKDSIEVKPEFKADLRGFRVCLNDTAIFSMVDPDTRQLKKLRSAEWKVSLATPPFTEFFTSNELMPQYVFRQDRDIKMVVHAVDSLGCVLDKEALSSVNKVWPPSLLAKDVCEKEPVELFFYSSDKYQNTDVWYALNGSNGDTIISEPKFKLINPPDTLIGTSVFQFNQAGKTRIDLAMVHKTEYKGDPTECRAFYDTTISVHPLPSLDFTYPIVCAGDESVQFTDKSTLLNGTIIGYVWDFGDGTTSKEKNPVHTYPKGGTYTVTLRVNSLPHGCRQSISKQVYVKHKPKAGFVTEGALERGVPITFLDTSLTYGASIVQSFYDFGDGTSSTQLNPQHQFEHTDEVKYNVVHTIVTDEGCKDTVAKEINLGVYLDIPSAFTPNGDLVNSTLGLIHKSIRELYEFKIYNRWGEVVFDAHGDVNKRWDGTFKGAEQEIGVYVVHVKAIGAYDTHFDFKKNVRLIR